MGAGVGGGQELPEVLERHTRVHDNDCSDDSHTSDCRLIIDCLTDGAFAHHYQRRDDERKDKEETRNATLRKILLLKYLAVQNSTSSIDHLQRRYVH